MSVSRASLKASTSAPSPQTSSSRSASASLATASLSGRSCRGGFSSSIEALFHRGIVVLVTFSYMVASFRITVKYMNALRIF